MLKNRVSKFVSVMATALTAKAIDIAVVKVNRVARGVLVFMALVFGVVRRDEWSWGLLIEFLEDLTRADCLLVIRRRRWRRDGDWPGRPLGVREWRAGDE